MGKKREKLKLVNRGGRLTKGEEERRLQRVLRLLSEQAGRRQYELATIIKDELGISRRAANSLLARGRAVVAAEHADRIKDLASALPDEIRALLDDCRNDGDRRTRERALRLVADLAAAAGKDDTPAGPTVIEFVTVDSPPRDPADNRLFEVDESDFEGLSGGK